MRDVKVPLWGIVGGVASGKSLIADELERQGAQVVRADNLAHEVLKLDEVKQEARGRWGETVFDADGQIDRRALGKIVFAPPPDGPRELKYLEQLTHPRIGQLMLAEIERSSHTAGAAAIVLDVPLLVESGWHKVCDKTLFVDAPRDLREARALERGWTPEDFAQREAAQESLAAKRNQADVVIDNSGSILSVREQVERVWKAWIGTNPNKST